MSQKLFTLSSPFSPAGSQPAAIQQLLEKRPGISTLLGITGSGKTYTIAHTIANQTKPVLVLAPNKTLAAQLYEEFSLFFPDNKVCYFVSYYDYYQPESYLPAQDIYIPKETKVNAEIERLRIEATASLINRRDTIIVTSVSCIYSLGNPHDYKELTFSLHVGQTIARMDLIRSLVYVQYERNEIDRRPGTFQVMGNTIEIQLPYQRDKLRIELFGNTIQALSWISKLQNSVTMNLDNAIIFPAKHFVTTPDKKDRAITSIQAELQAYAPTIENILYRHRIETRVAHDLDMLQETGYCSGIENYSAHFDGRMPDEKPFCLFDFFPKDFLFIIDESHIAIPQLKGMYAGDRARKKSLIEYGFRLPSAYDNRPLTFTEIEEYFNDVIFISATPGDYELQKSDHIVEQIIRPTGLIDPEIFIHPRESQLNHLLENIQLTTKKGYRTLITVLTKKLAEELAYYLEEKQIKVCYLHSDLKTPERTQLLQKLRLGIFDCLVGVNLLREGLDLPEVAFVAIMDADIESYLRDKRSLIQTIGRAARNTESKVIMYADTITKSMKGAIEETERRRTLQLAYNKEHGITPHSVSREVTKSITDLQEAIAHASSKKQQKKKPMHAELETYDSLSQKLTHLEKDMKDAARQMKFEKAIALRDQWIAIKQKMEQLLLRANQDSTKT